MADYGNDKTGNSDDPTSDCNNCHTDQENNENLKESVETTHNQENKNNCEVCDCNNGNICHEERHRETLLDQERMEKIITYYENMMEDDDNEFEETETILKRYENVCQQVRSFQ